MKNNIVRVLLWDQEICRLQWQGGYREGFGKVGSLVSFNPQYARLGFDVDPLGPFRKSAYLVQKGLSDLCRAKDYEGLPRFLNGSLPDDWGNQVFSSWIQNNGIRNHDVTPVDKLAFIGKRGMGGFEFVPELYSPSVEDSIKLEELYTLAREIERAREGTVLNLKDRPAIKDLMEVGMSAGGKHPKAIVAINWETGEVRSGQVHLPEGFTHYILKFRDSDHWPTAEIEYLYYLMAKDCGIDMERCSLINVGGVNHFLSERFDRKEGRKIHAATLQALYGEVHSYETAFKVCRGLHLPYHDIDQFFRRAVFNYLACVCDDHDKNISFLMDKDGIWRLSPAYDVTFTVNFKNLFIADRHSMTIQECDRRIRRSQFLRLAEENDVKNASAIIETIKEVVMSIGKRAQEIGIEPVFETAMADSIRQQMEALEQS